jgi:hypothetical protein
MPIPIFEQQTPEEMIKEIEEKKEKVSPWSVFISILLIGILVTMGEFSFRDSNRVFNPDYTACHVRLSFNTVHFLQTVGTPDNSCVLRTYEGTRLLLHADIAVPLFLIAILVFVLTRRRQLHSTAKVLIYSFFAFVAWMMIRIIFEMESFLVHHYALYGKYAVFLTIALVCTALIIFVQRQLKRKET